MKSKDTLSMEIKTLKSDLSKTGEIIKKLQASEKPVLEKLAIHERTEQLLKLTLDKYEVDLNLKQQEIQTLSDKNTYFKREIEALRDAKSFTTQYIKSEIEAKNQAELESRKLSLKMSFLESCSSSENGSNQHLQVYRRHFVPFAKRNGNKSLLLNVAIYSARPVWINKLKQDNEGVRAVTKISAQAIS
ncbi:hypothetical protein NEOLI_002836 [Neolecta irregularis DAH-3]|uniref:Uncharacterized protein n=1 Tax=Neolecta irregularis (strain DAH-3) TaxID=1198029 RepID=A0A1U7LR18_NEOID|nr:hypothetical protein NEOLI_002836 [Neolecta irregularis DAH-3]|eukprot:OLL25105.1 hypothetical protein NEOLI_002836 [Neolecta irregularis DAH-3]